MNQSNQFKLYQNFGTEYPSVIPSDLAKRSQINFENTANKVLTKQLVIDSSSRNWDTEEPNCYTVYLGEELKYVTSIELIDGRIPNSSYMITEGNNRLYFQETKSQVHHNDYYVAEVPIGNYSINDLLKELKKAMQTASGSGSKYQCKTDKSTHKITIETDDGVGTKIFNLIFTDGNEIIGDRGYIETQVIDEVTGRKEIRRVETGQTRNRYISNTIGQTLGFKAVNLCGFKSYTGQMVYKLRIDDYIALFINTENYDDFGNVIAPIPDSGSSDAFAIIQLNHNGEYFDLFADRHQVAENASFCRQFNPPISFSKFKVTFKTPNNKLYNFNGLDHYLLFEVKRAYDRKADLSCSNASLS